MKKRQVPLYEAITLLAIGILLGSAFCFGVPHWNAAVPREACTQVETRFISYDEQQRRHRIQEIAIDCANGERYFIDGVSIDDELRSALAACPQQARITLLIHPNSNTIVEFFTEGRLLLRFEDTIRQLGGEVTGFLALGLFLYACAGYGLYHTVLHFTRKKRWR